MAQQTFSGVPGTFSAGEILTASDQEKLRDFILYLIKDGDETDTGEVSPLILDLGSDIVDIVGALTITGDHDVTVATANTQILAAASGAATANNVTYSFSGDPDTGFFRSAANTMHAATNGSSKTTWTEAGNFLVGHAGTPLQKVDVIGNVYVQGPDGWNGAGDLALVQMGSAGAGETFGYGYKYGTGMILSVYKSGGGGSFGTNTYDAVTLGDAGNAGNMSVAGALSKGSGSFDIAHPTKGGDWRLRHSFIEGPQADLIYRGTVTLSGGAGTVDLDTASHMTDGTWEALCGDPWAMVASSGNAVEWSLSGKTLTITSDTVDAVCSWIVIAERRDDHMKDVSTIADPDGHLIVEYEKEPPDPDFRYGEASPTPVEPAASPA